MFASLALFAALIEAALGYPKWLLQRLGHPVMWIGSLIAWCETNWNNPNQPDSSRRRSGALVLVGIVAVAIIAAIATTTLIKTIVGAGLPGAIFSALLLALIASTFLAGRSLHEHVQNVADALEYEGVDAGRHAVSQIVGRDTTNLNEAEISRAAIESLSENFSDGVVAPLFWLVVAGLPGVAAYKAINTADSMIAHKSQRYAAFGFATAKVDDLANLPASRLAALWITLAAAILPSASAKNAYRSVMRDARHHRSPNAGWPEAAMAGALGIAISGPKLYGGEPHDDAWMGDGRQNTSAQDILNALRLYRLASVIQVLCLATIVFAMTFGF